MQNKGERSEVIKQTLLKAHRAKQGWSKLMKLKHFRKLISFLYACHPKQITNIVCNLLYIGLSKGKTFRNL